MKSQILPLSDDVVEILHNDNLTNRPYLLRLTNFSNERYELRLSQEEIMGLAEFIDNFGQNKK